MAGKTKLRRACEIALRDYMGLAPEETLLVITDENKREIGMNLFDAGKSMAHEAFYVEMLPREHNGEEPPEPIAELMKSVDVVIAPTTRSFTHTKARREASRLGVRVATMPGITVDTLVRCLNADYKIIVDFSEKIFHILKGASIIRVTTKLGTDIQFSTKGRKIIQSTGVLRKIGESGNLPSGEVYFAPADHTADGKIFFDGSFAGLGILKHYIKTTIKKGVATKITGTTEAKKLKAILDESGKGAYTLAEFGIGTNYKAILTGDILEDEKILGTVHFAFGNNMTMGGSVDVPIHLDGIVLDPTVWVDKVKIMEDGRFLID